MLKEIFVLIISCSLSYSEDNYLDPIYFKHHVFDTKLLQHFNQIEPTKQGPVLFPNDAPPPPRPPLIVTSRPLLEQISKSELNPEQVNNSIAEQSQIQNIETRPSYLSRQNVYTPYSIPTTPSSILLVDSATGRSIFGGNLQNNFQNFDYKQAYEDAVNKNRNYENNFGRERQYNDYEARSVLPPIYKALADHANHNVIKLQQKKLKVKPPADYENDYHTNELQNDDNNSKDYVQGKKYAFSYSVRDHKTGDDFSHSQHSSGDATNGEYRVRLPDGRMQIVSYVADENGYKADVRYDIDTDKIKDNTIVQPKQQEYKKPLTDDYYNQYSDLSKEYNNNDYIDYTNKNYNDYKYTNRKFAHYEPKNNNFGVIVVPNHIKSSTVKPSYAELKPLFVTRRPYQVSSSQNYIYNTIPIELNVPSTTANPYIYSEPTTERVVIIGTSKSPLYTNIRHSLPPLPVTSTPSSLYNSVSPSFGVSSTNAPILSKNVNFSNNKAILTSSFIDRINKYLNFN